VHIIVAHENADFDAVAALLAAHKLMPEALPVLPRQQNRNVSHFVTLYQNGLPFKHPDDVAFDRVEQITLVDTQQIPPFRGLPRAAQVRIIDHHPRRADLDPTHIFSGETLGATTTLLVERIEASGVRLASLEATLLALGIYEDTGSLSYGKTTPRDIRAAAWLLEQGASLDTVRKFLEPPFTDAQQRLFEQLIDSLETRTIQGYTVVVAAARSDTYVWGVSGIAHRLRDLLDPDAVFVLVEMSKTLHLVCRSNVDAIHVGGVARAFGGGGHERAAAATLKDHTFEAALPLLWEQITDVVQPAVRVADLMSYGVQTVAPAEPLGRVISQLRRIGHEGYPVVDDGRVVGLLTRRDADRAMEHGLGSMPVREVMIDGEITLQPSDSVSLLEQRMVESGWGQIPVVDEQRRPIGIVTRTDLIKHWARSHPDTQPPPGAIITGEQVEAVLGAPLASLIAVISQQAQAAHLTLYMVGGVVRDLLLKRANTDVDFVVEGDAIAFAEGLAGYFGGAIHSYRPFGTAKWRLDDSVAAALHLNLNDLPAYIDFASARNEFYEHPTALPTVYTSSIKLDLGRRDFTINTLAVQFSPPSGRVLDFFNGVDDLHGGIIRALHSLSFIDDPTRILRAVRFEHRLGFTIEPRTAQLIDTAKPMLRRITGERIRNELTLLLREQTPEKGLMALAARGVLAAIQPDFAVDDRLADWLALARDMSLPWMLPPFDLDELYWHLIACQMPPEAISAVNERLLTGRTLSESMTGAAVLMQMGGWLADDATRPSQIDERLRPLPDLALLACWLVIEPPLARTKIQRYVTQWREMRPHTDGHRLRQMGLKPGRCYSLILGRLRAALLDGEIHSAADEDALLSQLIADNLCEDDAHPSGS
jgi:tRNA nucleotidyltransferase (CCA-adding enzyme)